MSESRASLKELPLRVYSPEPFLRHWRELLSALLRGGGYAGRELAWSLFVRDLQAQYRRTYFGYFWAILPPLAVSLTFIFLNSQGIVKTGGGGIPYAAFAMIGTLFWQVFADSLSSPVRSLNAARPMLAKINFPQEALLLGGMYMVGFNLFIRLVLLGGVMIYWKICPGISFLAFPVAVFGLMLTGFAFGLLVAPISGIYGDVLNAIPIFTQFWMLLTPIVYPARTEGWAGVLAVWNPVSPLIITVRESLTGKELTCLPEALLVVAIAGVVSFIGLITLRLAIPHLIARMGG